MATIYSHGVEISINFHSLDSCGDIEYSFEFHSDGKNIINPEIIKPKYKDGKFITTECDFEDSGILNFFERIIKKNVGQSYESIEPPIIYIDTHGWEEKKEYVKNEYRNWKHIEGARAYSDKFIDNDLDNIYSQRVEIIFSIDGDYLLTDSKIGIRIETFISSLEEFVAEFRKEFEQFKKDNYEKHLELR